MIGKPPAEVPDSRFFRPFVSRVYTIVTDVHSGWNRPLRPRLGHGRHMWRPWRGPRRYYGETPAVTQPCKSRSMVTVGRRSRFQLQMYPTWHLLTITTRRTTNAQARYKKTPNSPNYRTKTNTQSTTLEVLIGQRVIVGQPTALEATIIADHSQGGVALPLRHPVKVATRLPTLRLCDIGPSRSY